MAAGEEVGAGDAAGVTAIERIGGDVRRAVSIIGAPVQAVSITRASALPADKNTRSDLRFGCALDRWLTTA